MKRPVPTKTPLEVLQKETMENVNE